MSAFRQHMDLGNRWVRHGWRLLMRNPPLMIGMGVCSSVLIAVLTLLPFIGTPIISVLAPALLASFVVTLDQQAKLKRPLSTGERTGMLKRSPRQLLNIFADENRALQVVMFSFACLAAVVVTDIILYIAIGGIWSDQKDLAAFGRFVGGVSFLLAAYAVIAAGLIYAIPLALLEKTPIVPAIQRSLLISRRHFAALLVPGALLLAPVFVGAVFSLVVGALGLVVAIALGALVVPLTIAAVYCSYRSVFAVPAAVTPVARVAKDVRAA